MKSHKMFRTIFLGIALLSGPFFLQSCQEDIKDMEQRDKIIGQWDVIENVAGVNPASVDVRDVNLAYSVRISASQVFADEVYLYNFFGKGNSFYVPASVNGNTITITEIELDDNKFRGQGTISSNYKTITWTYWVEDHFGDETEYRATYTFVQ